VKIAGQLLRLLRRFGRRGHSNRFVTQRQILQQSQAEGNLTGVLFIDSQFCREFGGVLENDRAYQFQQRSFAVNIKGYGGNFRQCLVEAIEHFSGVGAGQVRNKFLNPFPGGGTERQGR